MEDSQRLRCNVYTRRFQQRSIIGEKCKRSERESKTRTCTGPYPTSTKFPPTMEEQRYLPREIMRIGDEHQKRVMPRHLPSNSELLVPKVPKNAATFETPGG